MLQSRAAICVEVGRPLVLDTITVEDPREGEVLVKLAATGICATDLRALSGYGEKISLPAVLGHEGAGIVVKVGKGVESVREGDAVLPLYMPECGRCANCLSPDTNLCTALTSMQQVGLMPDGSTRFHWQDKQLFHFMGTSTFSEYTVLPEIALARIPDGVPLNRACLFACGVTTGIGAALKAAKVHSGSSVAVFGCGTIGLNVIQGCRLAEAATIIAVDLRDDRLERAREYGATHLIDASDGRAVQRVRRLTRGGADYTFEAIGIPAVMRDAFEACRFGGGKCCLIGLAAADAELAVDPQMFISGRSLMGTAFGGVKSRRQTPELIEWYRDGKIRLEGMVSQEIPLEQINAAIDQMRQDPGARPIILY